MASEAFALADALHADCKAVSEFLDASVRPIVEGSQSIACGRNGVACQDCTVNGGACFSGPTRDGGQDLVCAYGCPGPEINFGCKLYCSSPSDCVPGP